MRLRRYVGPDLPTVLRRIRRELGPNALIVKTEERVEGGILGFFGTRVVEVVAAESPGGEAREGRGLDLSLPREMPCGVPRGEARREGSGGGAAERQAASPPDEEGRRLRGQGFLPLGLACSGMGLPRRALALGPPGSGKTSVLGRLAWHFSAEGKAFLVSVEEEGRVSGVSRWEAFWKVLGVDYLAVKGCRGLRCAALEGEGVLLVDTPPLGVEWVEEMRGVCAELSLSPLLVVDASMDFEEFRLLRDRFRGWDDLRVVLCKMDTVCIPARRSRWEEELAGMTAYFSDHPSIDVPLKPLTIGRAVRDVSEVERSGVGKGRVEKSASASPAGRACADTGESDAMRFWRR